MSEKIKSIKLKISIFLFLLLFASKQSDARQGNKTLKKAVILACLFGKNIKVCGNFCADCDVKVCGKILGLKNTQAGPTGQAGASFVDVAKNLWWSQVQ